MMTTTQKSLECNSVFAPYIIEYTELKQSLGYKFLIEAYMLRQFDRYCDMTAVKKAHISSELMDNWLNTKELDKPSTKSHRLSTLKGFRDYLESIGLPVSWKPLPGYTLRNRQTRYVPYIFTNDEIKRIINSADGMRKRRKSDFDKIFPIILRILYCCGLRVSEVVSLRVKDIDTYDQFITVSNSKFEKSRRLPISESLNNSLISYMKLGIANIDENSFLFPNKKGGHFSKRSTYDTFREMLQSSGIPYQGKGKGPRLHDLRHTFAVHSLQKLIKEGNDVYYILPVLASYLGHTDIKTTEYYLRLVAEFYPDFLKKADIFTDSIIPEVIDYED